MMTNKIEKFRQEMVVSLQFLCIVTHILFFVEHEVQPEVYNNGWKW